jgi:hypothetical protein
LIARWQLTTCSHCAMQREMERFDRPSAIERLFNKLFGLLVGWGLGLPHNYLLQVRGRKSGQL